MLYDELQEVSSKNIPCRAVVSNKCCRRPCGLTRAESVRVLIFVYEYYTYGITRAYICIIMLRSCHGMCWAIVSNGFVVVCGVTIAHTRLTADLPVLALCPPKCASKYLRKTKQKNNNKNSTLIDRLFSLEVYRFISR